MSDKKEVPEAPMPEAYRTPQGRIVRANPTLHKRVQQGHYKFTPCELPKKERPKPKPKSKVEGETEKSPKQESNTN